MRERRGFAALLVLGALTQVIAGCKAKSEPDAGVVPPVVARSARAPASPVPAPVPTPPKPTPEAARAVESACKSICERSRTLKCGHASDCMANCLAMGVGTPCAEEFASLYRCLVGEPVEHWECAEDGVAAIREGYCEKEQEKSVVCMEAKAAR